MDLNNLAVYSNKVDYPDAMQKCLNTIFQTVKSMKTQTVRTFLGAKYTGLLIERQGDFVLLQHEMWMSKKPYWQIWKRGEMQARGKLRRYWFFVDRREKFEDIMQVWETKIDV